ncbi:transcriptional regulator [Neotabrizicola sp. VNH66]|uniref:transcriptional regulator n=1 Tax=Neotabrizicola sp. VNH66 TaxID=3400918 RepID=UPI003BFB6C7A
MARPKSLPDADVLREARLLHAAGGMKALTFGNLARATGLAASTLAQRFTTVEGLAAAAARDGWEGLVAAAAVAEAATSDKGPGAYLKALDAGAASVPALLELGRSDEGARLLAADWRNRVETALVVRLGQGEKARTAAQALFAAWQGQVLWGGAEFRIKDLARRLT